MSRARLLAPFLGLVSVGLAAMAGVPARAGAVSTTPPVHTASGTMRRSDTAAPDQVAGIPHADPAVATARAARPGTTARAGASTPAVRFRWPIRPRPTVLRTFAPGPHPWSAGHRGVDLGTAPETRIGSPAAGVLSFAGTVAGRGVAVVAHAGGLRTTFEPVLPLLPVGTVVAPGREFAVLAPGTQHCGATACLHWGAVRRDGGGRDTYLDPLGLLGIPSPVVLLPPTSSGRAVSARPAAGIR